MATVLTWMVIATAFSFSVAAPEEALISRIAFGSCANQTSPQVEFRCSHDKISVLLARGRTKRSAV